MMAAMLIIMLYKLSLLNGFLHTTLPIPHSKYWFFFFIYLFFLFCCFPFVFVFVVEPNTFSRLTIRWLSHHDIKNIPVELFSPYNLVNSLLNFFSSKIYFLIVVDFHLVFVFVVEPNTFSRLTIRWLSHLFPRWRSTILSKDNKRAANKVGVSV